MRSLYVTAPLRYRMDSNKLNSEEEFCKKRGGDVDFLRDDIRGKAWISEKSGEKYVFSGGGIVISHDNMKWHLQTQEQKLFLVLRICQGFLTQASLCRGTSYFLSFHKWQNILYSHAKKHFSAMEKYFYH